MRHKTAVLTIALILAFTAVAFADSYAPFLRDEPTKTPTVTRTPTPERAFLPIITNQQPMPTSPLPTETPTATATAPDVYATDIAEIRATLSAVQTVLASIVTPTP